MLKKISFYILLICLSLLGIVIAAIAPIDDTPYQQLPCQAQSKKAIDDFQATVIQAHTGFEIGWGQANITPTKPTELVGYGLNRYGKPTTEVHDSLFVRTLLIGNQQKNVAIVSFDLLFVSEELAAAVRERVRRVFPTLQYVYFSATHTHHSFGGWSGSGLASRFLLGGLQTQVLDGLVQQTIEALLIAHRQQQKATMTYQEVYAPTQIHNRVADNAPKDAYLRYFYCKNQSNEEAIWVTYAAHNTVMPVEKIAFSNDYVGLLLQKLTSNVKFSIFTAGMVGSHNLYCERANISDIQPCANALADSILKHKSIQEVQNVGQLRFGDVPIALRSPQLRIAEGWRLRPWLFEVLMGKVQPYMSFLQINDTKLIGMPCDFSGELMPDIQALRDIKNPLCITSFNGSYIGYVSHDRHYEGLIHEKQNYEIRDMNWFMPQEGSYFTWLVAQLAAK
ncbi:MAG: neutral/alkaline non-lysosomal ceramidase N-terminal domain-containing protein [Thermoflexibacteraceae bacterium]|jgi:neutral ceramidase